MVFRSRPVLNQRNRLLLVLALILALSFVGVSVMNYLLTRASVRQEIVRNDLPLTRDNIYSELSSELTRPILVASSMASDSLLKDWAQEGEADLDKITRYLEQIRERYGFFSTFFVSARTGRYYHYQGLHKVISPEDGHDVWYYNFIHSGRDYDLDVDTDEAGNNELTIFINYRLTSPSGELLGVTGVGMKMDAVARMVVEYQRKYHRAIYLMNARGVVQVHADKELIERADIWRMDGLGPLAGEILKTRSEPGNFEFERGGERVYLTVRYVPALDWLLFVEQEESESLAGARMNFIRTIVFGVAASVVIIGLTLTTINAYQRRVEAMAVTDELTGLANRRRLEQEFGKYAYGSERYGRDFSLILMDLDGFKRVNDSLGHVAGDEVLARVARLMATAVRPTDLVARWGGDEFVVLTESHGEEAAGVAERIRLMVREAGLAGPGAPDDDPRRRITICCGVTGVASGDTLDNMVTRADAAMYRCKAEGGDAVRRS